MILQNINIDLVSYLLFSNIVCTFYLLYFLYTDLKEFEIITVLDVIKNISLSLILGITWIISVPIFSTGKIISGIYLCYYYLKNKNIKEGEE